MPKVQYRGQYAMACLRPRRASRVTAGCEARVKAEVALGPSGGRWDAVSCGRRTPRPSWMAPGDQQPKRPCSRPALDCAVLHRPADADRTKIRVAQQQPKATSETFRGPAGRNLHGDQNTYHD